MDSVLPADSSLHPYQEASFRFEEHVGEVVLCAEAPTLASLFEQLATGLACTMAHALDGTHRTDVVVEVHAQEREALLVAWLNELIYLAETHGVVFNCPHVSEIDDRHVRATVQGMPVIESGTPVKAATYHRLEITSDPLGFSGRVVLDV